MSVSPPRPKGPPLNALRAFEAAARLGGFANAAEELCVTPGAISQHIKALEDWTGAPLFKRRSQGVQLTRAGAALLPKFTRAFDEMGLAVRALRAVTAEPTVHIAVLPSIAQLWLSPRLPHIRARLPHTRISVSALEIAPNLDREIFDFSLFIQSPCGAKTEIILESDEIVPVCAPEVASRLKGAGDLAGEILLHDVSWSGDWAYWCAAVGVDLPNVEEGPRFSLYSIALDEARSGAGVLIGHWPLVRAAVERGELVCPFSQRVPTEKALVLNMPSSGSPSVALKSLAKLLQ